MATVNKILLPRRGKKSVMKSPTKASMVLEKGEFFIEASDDGIGKGHAIIKVGDGTTPYSELGYAVGDTSNDEIEFENTLDSDIVSVINKIITKSKLCVLITNIRRAIVLLKNSDDSINNQLSELTDNFKITETVVVNSLPEDAADHPTTLYLIKSS